MLPSNTFHIVTLGCKVNQYESRALAEAWQDRGLTETDSPVEAGLIVVNSCAVTANAVADVRAAVRRLHREAPQAGIVLTGCAAETVGEGADGTAKPHGGTGVELAGLPGVIALVGQKSKALLLEPETLANLLERASIPGGQPRNAPPALIPTQSSENAPSFPAFSLSDYDRSRAVLKVQDGCSHGCTYCIVPLTRGRAVSRPAAEALAEARRLLDSGFREIGISGVNLRQYGRDLAQDAGDFWDLLAFLDRELSPEWAGRARLRLSSLEPGQLGNKALDVLAGCHLVAPHLHLSLQSGSPSVLRRMGRGHYAPESAPEFLRRLRGLWPLFGLGADLLTGFPGESAAEAEETLALCRELPLTYAHVFPYSRRPGTAAAVMDDQVPEADKKARAAALRALTQEKKTAFLRELLARERVSVVFEDRDGVTRPAAQGVWRGVNEFYADCVLEAPGASGASPLDPRVLTAARPLRIRRNALVVEHA